MNQLPDPKAAKKLAKAQAKAEKKRAKHLAKMGPMAQPAPPAARTGTGAGARGEAGTSHDDTPAAGPTPAERSAAAAERQVRLQRWRVAIALLTFIIAALTFLLIYRPWKSIQPAPPDEAPAEQPADP